MSTVFSSKQFLVKFVAVVVMVALIFGIAPVSGLSDLMLSASAENMPIYDEALGSFETETDLNGNTVLTATPNENCGFRGWYLSDGTEVSYDASYTLPSGASASDYIPVFYDFNLAKNGGFEEYASGTNLKSGVPEDEIWEGTCDGEINGGSDFTWAKVTNKRARSGNNSLEAFSYFNTTYHDFYGLEPNTQYTLKFWYNLDPNVEATDTTAAITRYMDFVSVLGEDMEMTVRANSGNDEYLACQDFDEVSGTCAEGEWKEVKITFYTEENTTVRLAFIYKSVYEDGAGTPAGANIYIDDVSLVKDVMASPDYFNQDFSSSIQNWGISSESKLSISRATGGSLKVTPKLTFGHIYSPVLKVKKGATYNISFDLDLSEVTMQYVPDEKDGVLLKDNSQITDDNPEGYYWYQHNGANASNWINLQLTTETKSYEDGVYYSSADSAIPSTQNWSFTDANGKVKSYGTNKTSSNMGFGRYDSGMSGYDFTKPLKVNISFTAHKSAEVYLKSRLNGLGSYYIDNMVVTEDASNTDYTDIVLSNTLKAKGTAIRTVGKQGMRYKTNLDKRLLVSDKYYGVRFTEYGTIAIKTEYLGENELTLDGEYDYNGVAYGVKKGVAYSFNDSIDKVYANNQTTLDFTGVLMNIAEEYWNSDYTARAYFKYIDKNGSEGVLYLDQSDIAVYPVAKVAYSTRNDENEFVESEEVRIYLYKNILSKFTDKIIKISDNSEPISTNFQGMRSTVYHPTAFFEDSHGRTYTEEQAAIEMDRLVDTKIDNVRTRLASQWMWSSNGWDWDSDKMTAIYKWAKMLQDRDITITLNASWHMSDFMSFYNSRFDGSTKGAHSSIPEVSYLHGYDDSFNSITNLYGEDIKANGLIEKGRAVNLELTDEEFEHYSVAAVRYGEWIKQALLAFKAHGINTVEYIMPFTETGYVKSGDPTYSYDEWMFMTMGLQDALVDAGIRNNYKVIGPNQALYANQNREVSFVEYIYQKLTGTNYEDMLDIVAMHQYVSPNTSAGYSASVYDPYSSYSVAEENFPYYVQVRQNAGVYDKEFWCDEYFASARDAWHHNDVGMQMTQYAAGFTAGMNNNVNRFLVWQMFDTLWDSEATHGYAHDPAFRPTSEFTGGVHMVGTCPSLVKADGETCTKENCNCKNYTQYSSYTPRKMYYGINLIGRFMNNENADVFATEVVDDALQNGVGVYVSAIKNDNGKTVIMVVNTMPTVSSVDIQIERNDWEAFDRYTYDPAEIVPTPEAKPLQSDKTIKLDGATSFKDTIPAGSFAIYVSSSEIIGDDVDIDIPEDFWDDITK